MEPLCLFSFEALSSKTSFFSTLERVWGFFEEFCLTVESGFSGERLVEVAAGLADGWRPAGGSLRAVSDLPREWCDCSGWPGMSKETFLTDEEDCMLRDSFERSDFVGSCGIVWLSGSLGFLRDESDRDVSLPVSCASTSARDFLSDALSLGTSTRGVGLGCGSGLAGCFLGCEAGRFVEKSL